VNYFCTYCDCGYAARLLCLHDSLLAQGEPFVLHVLCFDAETEAVIKATNKPSLTLIALNEILQSDPDYAAVRARRTRVEFYFTATPVLVRHCFARTASAEQMTYLDADLCFFGPSSSVFAAQGEASVGIVPHRFPRRLQHLDTNGVYNVGWVSFRRDASGLACLGWWRERCLEWCHDVVETGRYADQGYLDEFPIRFAGVHALPDPGINAAPWNIDGARIEVRDGAVHINDSPLLFYHFQGLRELAAGWFDPGLLFYSAKMTPALRDLVYLPYLRNLMAAQQELQRTHGIVPRRGYHRLTAGSSWRDRWHRFAVARLLPLYRRHRGQLLHCSAA
jgi:hypothetical protein